MADKKEPKRATSVRLNSQNLRSLGSMAMEDKRTVSALVNTAVDEYVNRRTSGIQGSEEGELHIDHDDLGRIAPVLEAMKNPCPISLFIQILKLQRPDRSLMA